MLSLVVSYLLISAQPEDYFFAHASAQQVEGEEVSDRIHYIDLICQGRECSLEIISVNDCIPMLHDGMTQRPYVERATTRDKTLKIDRLTPTVVEVSWFPDDLTVAKFSFTKEKFGRTVFTGVVVKNSVILNRIINFSYRQTLKPIEPKCPFGPPLAR